MRDDVLTSSLFVRSCCEMFKDVHLSSAYLLFWMADLCQGGEVVKVFGDVRIVNGAVMLRHFQRGVSQQLLEHKRIATTINQVFTGKGVAIQMGACFRHTTGLVVSGDRQPQAVH